MFYTITFLVMVRDLGNGYCNTSNDVFIYQHRYYKKSKACKQGTKKSISSTNCCLNTFTTWLLIHPNYFCDPIIFANTPCIKSQLWYNCFWTPSEVTLGFINALPSSLIHSTVSLKWKQQKIKESGHAPWLTTFWGLKGVLEL